VAESISSNCYAIGAGHLDELIRIWWMSRRHIDKDGRWYCAEWIYCFERI